MYMYKYTSMHVHVYNVLYAWYATRQYMYMYMFLYSVFYSITSSVSISIDGSCGTHICRENVPGIFQALFEGMNDYTTDSRGDIGSM